MYAIAAFQLYIFAMERDIAVVVYGGGGGGGGGHQPLTTGRQAGRQLYD